MTFDEFVAKVYAVFPSAEVAMDNDHQLIIYTNLTIANDEIVEFAE